MTYLYVFLGWVMNVCYGLCNNYGLAIILFTLVSKIILLPASLWTYFNSITMIKLQPDINFLKVKYYGQKDVIAEEQSRLFKEKKYHPLASTIPLIIQLLLLMGVVEIIKEGTANPEINMFFGPFDLGLVPNQEGAGLIWVPFVAGISSWILCLVQNASNVLQSEQSKYNKYGTMLFSVGFSLYLGIFVSLGTAFYWVCSNFMGVLQLYILNWIIRPKRYVDYEKLEASRKALKSIQSVGKSKREIFFSENKRRSRADYKRFFSVINKHIVFYSEGKGFYKYFKGYIEYILMHTNLTVHYITSDPQDDIFGLAEDNTQIRAYYIDENRLITLMMKMDADVVVMTMPDLENFHIKRSYVRDDIEYIFVQHDVESHNMVMRRGCMDHFDTIFCAGPHQKEELLQTEEVYHLPSKKLIEVGYPLLDEMRIEYSPHVGEENEKIKILIAPSWQRDNIIDNCLEEILDALDGKGYEIIVRPHPQEVRLKHQYMQALKQKYENSDIEIQTDFSSNNPVLDADILITDWSGISWEYAFTTRRPILYINTPMKIMNPEYEKIDVKLLNILLRDSVGKSLDLNELDKTAETVEYLLKNREEYKEHIEILCHEYIYNIGASAKVGAMYMIQTIKRAIAEKESKEK